MNKFSFVSNLDVAAFDALYKQYLANPETVDISWQRFFEGFEFSKHNFNQNENIPVEQLRKEFNVLQLLNYYRENGHLHAQMNPLQKSEAVDLAKFDLTPEDLTNNFTVLGTQNLGNFNTLGEALSFLTKIYCHSIGIEQQHLPTSERSWLQNKLESDHVKDFAFSTEQKKMLYEKIAQANLLEQFLHRKFVGQKRFSVEGAEGLIPALQMIVENTNTLGIDEVIAGMAHRGRLNVLVNILEKPAHLLFAEFESKEFDDPTADGDVKYHMGFSNRIKNTTWTLLPNPSHLETVNAVVEGFARARIDQTSKNNKTILPILIHGDAAFSGQGIVYEVLQMSQLPGYTTGGTIHFIVNNQVGFTTNFSDSRSSFYATDLAKSIAVPVFHVNGNDTEALAYITRLALAYRQEFGKDVIVDIIAYRKYGHNEGDEPRFTQPLMYEQLGTMSNPKEIYQKQLLQENNINATNIEEIESNYQNFLQQNLDKAKTITRTPLVNFIAPMWQDIPDAVPSDFEKKITTSLPKKDLVSWAKTISTLPAGENFFSKIVRIMEDRQKLIQENNLDWGLGELLAYASLLNDGHNIRLSGQDVQRGTFSHRHAVIKNENTENPYIIFDSLATKSRFDAYNSLLSEYGVMGFEYGYAMASKNDLIIWEAQFGDFNNGAQIIIDQYLSAAEEKWKTKNALVLLLPHGYEGQGAEHSSGRMERFLQLCAEENMQITNCTTPANYFHLLRKQLKQNIRKPLVVFTPKSLLRHPKCISSFDDLSNGHFMPIIDDEKVKSNDVKKLIFCSGKVYYDLLERRKQLQLEESVALIRFEQLYPLPVNALDTILKKYKDCKKIIWAQEEPENMGAWSYIMRALYGKLELKVVSPSASGATAAGSTKLHEKRHQDMLQRAFE